MHPCFFKLMSICFTSLLLLLIGRVSLVASSNKYHISIKKKLQQIIAHMKLSVRAYHFRFSLIHARHDCKAMHFAMAFTSNFADIG